MFWTSYTLMLLFSHLHQFIIISLCTLGLCVAYLHFRVN